MVEHKIRTSHTFDRIIPIDLVEEYDTIVTEMKDLGGVFSDKSVEDKARYKELDFQLSKFDMFLVDLKTTKVFKNDMRNIEEFRCVCGESFKTYELVMEHLKTCKNK